jgi:hypothetical protein
VFQKKRKSNTTSKMNISDIKKTIASLEMQINELKALIETRSETSEISEPQKPKRVLSAEHKAKLAEGRMKKAAEKALEKIAEPIADSVSSDADSTTSSQKKRGRPKMTDEQKKEAKAKRDAEKAGADVAQSSEITQETSSVAPKKKGRKALKDMTPEELAAHKAKVAQRKDKKSSESAPAPAPAPATSEEKPSEDDLDSAEPWTFLGNSYFKTGRHEVWHNNNGEMGDWIGVYDPSTGKIDITAPEPDVDW